MPEAGSTLDQVESGATALGWSDALSARLDDARAHGLDRRPWPTPRRLTDLASNDYLGLRRHPRLIDAASRALREHGVGAGGSRLAGGDHQTHRAAEAALAEFKGAEDARLLTSGFLANLALLGAVARPGDLILLDKLCHASLIDGARLAASSARPARIEVRAFAHGSVARARTIAARHLDAAPDSTVWLITESVFSMDGDLAPLAALADLRDEINQRGVGSCCLIADEAHATGVIGPGGAGLDALVRSESGRGADICIVTASKALGGLGGAIVGPRLATSAVDHFARAFIYTTGLPPAQAAALREALRVIQDEPERRERLIGVIRGTRAGLREQGWAVAPFEEAPTPIIPLPARDSEAAIGLAQHLADRGFMAPAIRPPTVAPGAARVRLSLHADLDRSSVDKLLEALAAWRGARGISSCP